MCRCDRLVQALASLALSGWSVTGISQTQSVDPSWILYLNSRGRGAFDSSVCCGGSLALAYRAAMGVGLLTPPTLASGSPAP